MSFPTWTDQQIDRLRSLCVSAECGNSRWIARQINQEFNTDYTRNAIIGKMKRLDINSPHPKNPFKIKKIKKTRRSVFNFAKPTATPVVDDGPALMPTEFPNKCSLMELTNETCRWPVNDPWTAEFFFCGSPEADLLKRVPYCRAHARAAVTHRVVSTG